MRPDNDNEADPYHYVVCMMCDCGYFLVQRRDGFDWILCAQCGHDMTELVFRDIGHA